MSKQAQGLRLRVCTTVRVHLPLGKMERRQTSSLTIRISEILVFPQHYTLGFLRGTGKLECVLSGQAAVHYYSKVVQVHL